MISDDQKIIAKAVTEIAERDGVCTPAAFVEEARPESSPLHELFDWDQAANAQRWLEHRARQLIGRVKVDLRGTRAPAFVHVSVKSGREREGYLPIEAALTDRDLRRQVFAEARAGLAGWERRLTVFTEAQASVSLIREAIKWLKEEEEEDTD